MSTDDLLDHFKLEAEVLPDHTLHVSYRPNRARGVREKVVTKWQRVACVGEGAFGKVWREQHQQPDGTHQVRAVKIIGKQGMSASRVDFKKELLALAKFSKEEVLKKDPCSPQHLAAELIFACASIEKPRCLSHFLAGMRLTAKYSLQWSISRMETWLSTSRASLPKMK